MKVLTCLRTLIVLLCIGYYSVFAAEAPRRASNAPNQRNNGPSSSGFSKDSRVPSTESNNGGSRPNTYLSRNPERAALNNNKNKFDFDGKPNGSEEAKNWKSGQIFNQKRKSQRNDPWWMRYEYFLYMHTFF